jgi:hypothetical protein
VNLFHKAVHQFDVIVYLRKRGIRCGGHMDDPAQMARLPQLKRMPQQRAGVARWPCGGPSELRVRGNLDTRITERRYRIAEIERYEISRNEVWGRERRFEDGNRM